MIDPLICDYDDIRQVAYRLGMETPDIDALLAQPRHRIPRIARWMRFFRWAYFCIAWGTLAAVGIILALGLYKIIQNIC